MVVLPMGTYPGYRSQCHTAKESISCNLMDRVQTEMELGENLVFNQN